MVTTGRRERKRKRTHLLLLPGFEGTRTVVREVRRGEKDARSFHLSWKVR
jgi:hypothetical protein